MHVTMKVLNSYDGKTKTSHMGSIRAESVMENVWLVFEFGGNYKSAQIFSTASCGPLVFGISYFAYFLYNPRRVR